MPATARHTDAFQTTPDAIPRRLVLENVHNARDLGGLTGADGRRVRTGKLFRSGSPGRASAADLEQLSALGLEAVIDFRAEPEKAHDEPLFGQRFHWIASPVLDGNMAMAVLLPRLRDATQDFSTSMMVDIYREFPSRYQQPFGGFLQTAMTGKTLLFHCTAGKDRTGFASLLLLSALGVAHDDIVANYLESNHWNAGFFQEILSKSAARGVKDDVMMPLLEVAPAYLDASVQAIEQDFGGMDRYLRDVLKVDAEVLREHYLEG
ncbi:tyrosine-protein phosphatase [Achromobacter sp. NPDC008082]|uniref:tyrosine-protein phosphatase n=1 Tax=Achromobacter sp. NPDC008082 TaxID=3363888 RepID=UPI0036EC5DDE